MDLEHKRKELELVKVIAARKEQEFRIDEKLHEIEKIKESIKASLKREAELQDILKKASK